MPIDGPGLYWYNGKCQLTFDFWLNLWPHGHQHLYLLLSLAFGISWWSITIKTCKDPDRHTSRPHAHAGTLLLLAANSWAQQTRSGHPLPPLFQPTWMRVWWENILRGEEMVCTAAGLWYGCWIMCGPRSHPLCTNLSSICWQCATSSSICDSLPQVFSWPENRGI